MGPLIALLCLQQQVADVRVYRMYQGGAEVGRETYRVLDQRTHDYSVVIPLLNLKQDTRVTLGETGRLERMELRAANLAGDTVRVTASVWRSGDSLLYRQEVRGRVREGSLRGVPDGVVQSQTVAIVAFAAERAAGRDTVLRLLPMGSDSFIDVRIRHRGDTAAVSLGPVEAWTALAANRAGRIEMPVQRVVAELWNGRDSLPPLPGLRRPTPDYAAPPGAPYAAEEVRIPVDSFVLAGTLTRPAGARGPVPVVITVSGSGQQERDEELWPVVTGYRPFRQIAERLAQAGIAVLRYDDRMVGGSGGALGTSADYAEDVGRIAAWLRARSDLDGRRVAVLGHSEGGLIGPLVAANDGAIAAVVVMAGPGKNGLEILRDQFTRPIVTAQGLGEAERARLLAGIDRQIAEFRETNEWSRFFATHDPLAVARRVRQPVLIVHGALDRQVSVGQADTLAAAFRAGGNRDVTVRTFPRLNHLFLPTDGDGSPAEYSALPSTAVPAEVLDTIAGWLAQRLRSGP
jgi:dienelactone hydrolase